MLIKTHENEILRTEGSFLHVEKEKCSQFADVYVVKINDTVVTEPLSDWSVNAVIEKIWDACRAEASSLDMKALCKGLE